MQATDAHRWAGRPALGRIVRALAYLVPVAASVAVAWSLTELTPTPESTIAAVVRWLAIAAFSSVVLVLVERVARRLLPVAALLELTLIFPDRAPSRFRVALRTGSTRQLERRLAESDRGEHETPAEAAERIVELVAGLRTHDRITRGHAERVRAYTQMIAAEMGLPDSERERLRWAGLLHDIGKLRVPSSILNKTGRLTDSEFEIIKEHPEQGRRIIEPLIPWLGESARAVWEHHERWDGGGYPRGLAGDEISLAARIVSVADVYDVMTSVRSYKSACTPAEARAEIARCAGTQFDPDVVRAFLRLSLGDVRAAGGPVSWLAQLSLFPTAVVSSTHALGGAAVLTGALAASVVGATPAAVQAAVAPSRLLGVEAPWTSDDGRQLPEPRLVAPSSADDGNGAVPVDPSTTDGSDPTAPTPTNTATTIRDAGPATTLPPTTGPTIVPSTLTVPTPARPTTVAPITTPTITPITTPTTTPTITPITTPTTIASVLTTPELTLPPLTTPGVTMPGVTVLPGVTVPSLTIPGVTLLPGVTVPSLTVPNLTGTTVPGSSPTTTTLPIVPITVPTVTVPSLPGPGLLGG